ncbi:hypothetical protein C0992_002557 [Termitomyces sp. T32_za158]|nr:hypothetical protein C0992_002557 [Termitomyces sp. T32_za158]
MDTTNQPLESTRDGETIDQSLAYPHDETTEPGHPGSVTAEDRRDESLQQQKEMPGGAHWSEARPTAAPGGEARQGATWATPDQNPGREAALYMQPGRPGRTIQTRSTGQGAAEGRRPTGQAIGRIPRPEGSWRVPTESMPMSMRQQGNGGAQEGKLPEQRTPAVHWEDETSDEEEGQRVPPETEFLSDLVAQVVITGLLDEIVMLQQRNDNTIKTFATALKRRRASLEGHEEAKRLRASERGEERRAAGLETARHQKEPGEVTPTPSDLYDELVLVDESLRGLSSSAHAPAAGKGHTRREDNLELMPIPFTAGVPKGADSSIMKFLAVVCFEAPLTAYKSAVLAKDT